MKLKELHHGMERYLIKSCYCPGEIYDTSGFFYQLFNADDTCEKLTETDDFIACLSKNQMLIFWKDESGDRITDAVRYDATENNVKGLMNFIKNGEKFMEDHFDKEGHKRSIEELLQLCSGFVIRD